MSWLRYWVHARCLVYRSVGCKYHRTTSGQLRVLRYAIRHWFFSQGRKLIGTARCPSWLGMLIGPSPYHCSPIGRPPVHSSVKNEYLVLPLGEETAVQAVVGSIVRAFRRLKEPRIRERSARGYALYSVFPQLSSLFLPYGASSFLSHNRGRLQYSRLDFRLVVTSVGLSGLPLLNRTLTRVEYFYLRDKIYFCSRNWNLSPQIGSKRRLGRVNTGTLPVVWQAVLLVTTHNLATC